jgi:carbon storage regulator
LAEQVWRKEDLTRKLGESIVIGDNIIVTVSDIKNGQIKLGISAPKNVTVNREEVVREIKGENVLSSASGVTNYIKDS